MTSEVCPECGLTLIGGKCLTRTCDNRDESVGEILGE